MSASGGVLEGIGDHLLVDLYELTMLQAYVEARMVGPASFELFVRRLPRTRNFLIAAGLEQALEFLEGFALSDVEVAQLARVHRFSQEVLHTLRGLRFSGDVEAVPEGTVVFANEPLISITAPLPEAQIVETRLTNLLHFQTLVASKAARAVLAAAGRPLVDFGLRRAHGGESGTLGARAMYLAGFSGTSNVRAGSEFGIPILGTMAHSFVQAHDEERQAFVDFAAANPGQEITLLIDTYETERATAQVVSLAPELTARGSKVAAVRIDSGDLGMHARRVRRILDEGGLKDTRIIVSSGLDEHEIAALLSSGAPVDGFAPGTKVITSADAPYLDCAYKLVEYAGRPRLKRSEGKETWPGRKQVWRERDARGVLVADHVTRADERVEGAEPLLAPAMRGGRPMGPRPSLEDIRARVRRELAALPAVLRELSPVAPFSPQPSDALMAEPAHTIQKPRTGRRPDRAGNSFPSLYMSTTGARFSPVACLGRTAT